MYVVPKVFFNGFTGRGNACKLERAKSLRAEGPRKAQRKLSSKCIWQVHALIAHRSCGRPGNGHRAEGTGYLRTWHQALGAHRGASRW